MIRIRSWAKWQGPAVYEIVRKRKKDARPMPVILGYVAVASDFDDKTGNFERFADLIGGAILARGYLTMVLGYIARKDASSDTIRCGPAQFGHLVLSDRLVQTSPRIGQKVYEALILSGIAEEIDPAKEAQSGREPSPPDSRPDSRPSGPPSGPGRGERTGADLTRVPPSPRPEGSFSPAAPEQRSSNGSTPTGDLRTRLERALTYAINTAPTAEAERAKIVRDRLRKGDVSDPEASTLLAGEFLLAEHDSRNHTAAPAPNATAQRVIGEALRMLASPRQRAGMDTATPPS